MEVFQGYSLNAAHLKSHLSKGIRVLHNIIYSILNLLLCRFIVQVLRGIEYLRK